MNKGRGFQNGWWLLLITLGVMLATELPFAFTSSEQYSFTYMLFNEITLIIPIIVGFSFVNLEQGDGRVMECMGLKSFPLKLLPFVVLLPVTGQFFISYVTMPLQAVLTLLLGAREYSFPSDTDSFWQNFLLMCVLAPIFEEILCRGILMNLFKRYGTAKMLVYSSLGFALLHLDAEAFLPLFFVGLMLGSMRITTGSIFAPMIAHSASNLFALLSLTFNTAEIFDAVLMMLCVVAFPIIVWFYFKKCDGKTGKGDLARNTSAPTGISVGFALVVAVFLIFNIVAFVTRLMSGELYYDLSRLFIG